LHFLRSQAVSQMLTHLGLIKRDVLPPLPSRPPADCSPTTETSPAGAASCAIARVRSQRLPEPANSGAGPLHPILSQSQPRWKAVFTSIRGVVNSADYGRFGVQILRPACRECQSASHNSKTFNVVVVTNSVCSSDARQQ